MTWDILQLALAWHFPPAVHTPVSLWDYLWFPCHLCHCIFCVLFLNSSCPLAWFFHSFASAAHFLLPKTLLPVISLTPSYSDYFHPAFLVRPSPCSCQGSVLHASICWRSSQLSPWSPFLLKWHCFPRWSHPISQLLDGHRLLHLYFQARFLTTLDLYMQLPT